jgi:threonine/homoserine/homoserine lactone efflux protein
MSALPSFVAVSIVVIVTPGPDTALTIRNTLRGGRRAGVSTAVGVALGQCTWALLAAIGVAGLVAASDEAFTAVKIAGAAYLAYLGALALRDAWRGAAHVAEAPEARADRRGALRQGLYSNIANPKMAAFFTGLLPQFAPGGSPHALLALGCVFALMTLAWLSAYATVLWRVRGALARTRVRRALDAAMGATLIALAARLAAERRT